MPPRLSVVLLTWNEEPNIGACLDALARQDDHGFEVIVVDAASTDGTVPIVKAAQASFPVPLRLRVAGRRIPIGEARNLGVALAHEAAVAFLSADAEPERDWTARMRRSLDSCDMVFGRQVHDPRRWTAAAAVRGLRYHFPRGMAPDPLRYASNVAAGYRRKVLLAFPFDPWANAAEDLLLARRAAAAGFQAAYDPQMAVRHHDVASAGQEMRKNIREGQGWGVYAGELGLLWPVLAWGAAFALALGLLLVRPGPGVALAAAVLWLPALRRAVRRRRAMRLRHILKGVAASPPFDLAFLVNYLRGLRRSRGGRARHPNRKETQA
jgi:glycosyltransferase involved in cell wall biosynthesis